MAKKDLLNYHRLSRADIEAIFRLAADLKHQLKSGIAHPLLAHRCLAMIFEK
ncbi:MAG: ornithine carbamoyltransferase, partial [Deltaproteobacteria bacterium]|nr:ornithine carbamoyltransferase [Deltaproteobacteria bacterium]